MTGGPDVDRIGRRRADSDRGNITLEAAIIVPALLMFVGMIIAAGRVSLAGGAIEAAARDAARQASIARDPVDARRQALASAQSALRREGLQCTPSVDVDTSGFARPLGAEASVRVDVDCTVRLGDLVVPGLPGGRHMHASFSSPIDPYRGR